MLLLLNIEISHFQAGALFGAVLGALLGLIPLILGIRRKKAKIGILGFVSSIVGNALLGLLLSIPIVAICTYLILKQRTPEVVSDSQTSTVIEDSRIS
jgi:hypothetical protein